MLQEARPLMNDDSSTSPSISLDDFARQLERSRIQALLARNMQVLWRLHAADYQLITPSGRSFSRDHYLRKIEVRRPSLLAFRNITVRWKSDQVKRLPLFDIKPRLSSHPPMAEADRSNAGTRTVMNERTTRGRPCGRKPRKSDSPGIGACRPSAAVPLRRTICLTADAFLFAASRLDCVHE